MRPSAPSWPIWSGVAMRTSKSSQFSLIFARILGADEIGAGRFGFTRFFTGGDDEHAHRLTRTGRKDDRATHDLIGVARIDAEADCDLDGLIELGESARLDELERLRGSYVMS